MTRGFKKVPNANDILNTLTTSDFHDWYTEELNDYVVAESSAKPVAEILDDIAQFFGVEVEK